MVKLSLGGVVAGRRAADRGIGPARSVHAHWRIRSDRSRAGLETYAGALVRRGEAVAEVTATGARTKFGRTAELVRTAHVESSQQKTVLRVVRNLAIFNGVIIVMLVAYAYALKMPVGEIIPLVLTAVLASIPVALPATFTLAAAVGARALAKLGVLPTRLSAVDEAASIDVLCSDKTGTLTRNELTVTAVTPCPASMRRTCWDGALASSDGGQDPVDMAIRSAAQESSLRSTEADQVRSIRSSHEDVRGDRHRYGRRHGACREGGVCRGRRPDASDSGGGQTANELEAKGFRVLAVAVGPPAALKLAGIIALSDPPRTDSAELITELRRWACAP